MLFRSRGKTMESQRKSVICSTMPVVEEIIFGTDGIVRMQDDDGTATEEIFIEVDLNNDLMEPENQVQGLEMGHTVDNKEIDRKSVV